LNGLQFERKNQLNAESAGGTGGIEREARITNEIRCDSMRFNVQASRLRRKSLSCFFLSKSKPFKIPIY
jgi:hypothetical protein